MSDSGSPGLTGMTFEDYWQDYEIIQGDVAKAMAAFHLYELLSSASSRAPDVADKLKRFPLLWETLLNSLLTTYFIVLARVMDEKPKAHSIHKVLSATIAHPEFFSKTAIRRRRNKRLGNKQDPPWLLDYDDGLKWEATTEALRSFQKSFRKYASSFRVIYQPIRSRLIAHNFEKDPAKISELLDKGESSQLQEIVHAVHNVTLAIWEMAYNGKEPELSSDYRYESRLKQLNDEAETFLSLLVQSHPG